MAVLCEKEDSGKVSLDKLIFEQSFHRNESVNHADNWEETFQTNEHFR